MTLVRYPMQDNYETTLSQQRDWATGTVYVKTAPSFTMPANSYCVVTVDPWTEKEQAFLMDSFSTSNKTLNAYSITVNKWPGLAYTQQPHWVGAKVIISDNYANREALKTEIDWKVDTNSADIETWKFANATARDAFFTSPVNGNSAYLTSEWYRTDYVGGAWVERATGAVSNASTTVAWKVEISTGAENTAWTSTGWTGASLVPTPWGMATVIQSWSYTYAWASATGNDTYVVSMTPALTAYTTGMRISFLTDVANTWACTINVNSLWAKSIKTQAWLDPVDWFLASWSIISLVYDWTNFVIQNPPKLATNAEAWTWTDTKTVITPSQLIYAWSTPIAWTDVTVASLTTERNHSTSTYTQKYIGTILRTWTYTVSFWLSRNDPYWWWWTAYWRIYKNWVAFGTEQSTTSVHPTFVTKTENLAFTAWDTISLRLKNWWPADTAYANNFLITCSQPHFTIT